MFNFKYLLYFLNWPKKFINSFKKFDDEYIVFLIFLFSLFTKRVKMYAYIIFFILPNVVTYKLNSQYVFFVNMFISKSNSFR